MPSLAPIVEMVKNGVVRITTRQRLVSAAERAGTAGRTDGNEPEPTNTGGPRLSDPDLLPIRYQGEIESKGKLRNVGGTGFVVHTDGLIVTSHHVVEGYESIEVMIPGHTRPFDAELLGEDTASDLAVLRLVDPPSGLQALSLADSQQVRQGDWVLSIGNPFEFHQTLSVGIITYVGRHVLEDEIKVTNDYLQFSAPVNPGDSGAALFDMAGNVVGMTRRTLTEGKSLSFAVPSKRIKNLLADIQRGVTKVRRGYLGIQFRQPRHPEALRGLVDEGGGAEVTEIRQGHPAETAGIRVGDVILSYEGRAIEDAADLYDWIIEARPGAPKAMSVIRQGQVLAPITVIIGELGAVEKTSPG